MLEELNSIWVAASKVMDMLLLTQDISTLSWVLEAFRMRGTVIVLWKVTAEESTNKLQVVAMAT